MQQPEAIFLINLLQDVNILRPVILIAAREMNLRTKLLLSKGFLERDDIGSWRQELTEICNSSGAEIIQYHTDEDVQLMLLKSSGVLIAGSESSLGGHAATHNIFKAAPPSFLKITMQHGFECVGFLHGRDHELQFGSTVTFAADIVCGWCEGSILASMAPSQRSKLYVSGPPAVLQTPEPATCATSDKVGLVCENLHSARFKAAADFKQDFIDVFDQFCQTLALDNEKVALRPHPGGQYVLKNKLELPGNVIINNMPIYKVDLSQYAYGISAPSSVLIDMLLANIPIAVWREPSGVMDSSNYAGLTQISTVQDWMDFKKEALSQPDRFLERQQLFLEKLMMPIQPSNVRQRFVTLLRAATSRL